MKGCGNTDIFLQKVVGGVRKRFLAMKTAPISHNKPMAAALDSSII